MIDEFIDGRRADFRLQHRRRALVNFERLTTLTTFEIAEIVIRAAHGLKLPPVQISAKSVKNYDDSSRQELRRQQPMMSKAV